MLTLSEVLQLKLHSEMVVLSAYNTGSGKVTRFEGVTSMGTAFLAIRATKSSRFRSVLCVIRVFFMDADARMGTHLRPAQSPYEPRVNGNF